MGEEATRDSLDETIDALGLASLVQDHPEYKEVIRRALETNPLVSRSEVELQQEWHDRLWKHRDWLTSLTHEGAAAFDRTLIALASGGIALSIAFLNAFGATSVISNILLVAWIALVASILLTVASMAVSRWSVRAEIEAVDDLIKNPISMLTKPKRNEALPRRSKRIASATIWLSVLAGIAFLVGMLGLIHFAVDSKEAGNGAGAFVSMPERVNTEQAVGSEAAETSETDTAGASEREEGIRAAAAAAETAAPPSAAAEEALIGSWWGEDHTGEIVRLRFAADGTLEVPGLELEAPEGTHIEYAALPETSPAQLYIKLLRNGQLIGKVPFAIYKFESSRLVLCMVKEFRTKVSGIPFGARQYEFPSEFSGACMAMSRM